ncbi:MAG: Pr6Pr family membrane protein [Solirubrobacterales bacterium]
MEVSRTTRRVHIAVAVFVATALGLRLLLTIFWPSADLDPHLLVRLERFISYFTIQSNIAALLASLAVVRGRPLDTAVGRALRLAALVGMTVTCIVYIVVLSGDSTNTGMDQVTNLMLHYFGPPIFVLAWVFFGPFLSLGWSDIPRALIWPLLWIVYTLVHGAITGWYPYPFIDVTAKGYADVFVSIGFITLFALLLSAAFVGVARLRERDPA